MPLDSEGTIEVDTSVNAIGDAVSEFFTEHCVINVDRQYWDAILGQLWMTAQAVCSGETPQMVQFGFQSLETSPMRFVLHTPGACAGSLQWAFGKPDVITLSPDSPLVKRAVGMEGLFFLSAAPKLLTFGNDVVWQARD